MATTSIDKMTGPEKPFPNDKAGLSPTVGKPVHIKGDRLTAPDGTTKPVKSKPVAYSARTPS